MLISTTPFWFSAWSSISVTLIAVFMYWSLRIHIYRTFYLPLRHALQIIVLVLIPSQALIMIYMNKQLWLLFVFALTTIGLFVSLEIYLRKVLLTSENRSFNFRHSQGRNGVQVPYSEAREASGDFPYVYMTEEFFNSIQYNVMYERDPSIKIRLKQNIHYDLAFDYDSPGISVKNGLRTTTDQPSSFERSLLFFGGSTTFGGREVPDNLTFCSILQRQFNSSGNKVIVINHGQGGATVLDRVQWLIESTPVNSGDIICFYFGANDSGWKVRFNKKMRNQIEMQPPLLQLMRRGPLLKSAVIQWIYGENAFFHNQRCADKAVGDSIRSLELARKWANAKGCKFLVALQPQIYASKKYSDYEAMLRSRFSNFLIGQLALAYPRYENFVAKCGYGVSMTALFDNIDHSVYLDWCHLNARGNTIIANRFWELLSNFDQMQAESA